MPLIPLQELRPGLTLAEDIESPDGHYRLCAGQELAASHLRLLRGWRVREAAVEDVPAASPGPETAALAQELPADDAADVRTRFAHVPLDEPLVAVLLAQAQARADRSPGPARRLPARCESARKNPPTAGQLIDGDPILVSLPEVFMRIREVVSDPASNVEEVTAVIGKDPSLTANCSNSSTVPFTPAPCGSRAACRRAGSTPCPGRCCCLASTNCPPWPWASPCCRFSRTFRPSASTCASSGVIAWPWGS
jgi:hypothetical protein